MNGLEGRVAVVTGGARGIGDAIVQRLLGDGAKVVSMDRIAPEEARSGADYLDADVSDAHSVETAFREIDRLHGQVDIVVNNAGIAITGLIGKMSHEDFSAIVGTHLHGFFLCSSQAIPRMIKRGKGGSIIAIASTAAFVGFPGRSPYCAAKAGMLGLMRGMALEVADMGIRVNAVAPGHTRTKIVDNAIALGTVKEEWLLARAPMHRLGRPEEIANGVRFLAGDESAYMTGQTIVIDGGWTVQGIPEGPSWASA